MSSISASAGSDAAVPPLNILHVFRTPVGGLFRHVRDLARGQAALGHRLGVVCDSTTGGDGAVQALAGISQYCSLGIERRLISRLPGLGDLSGARAVAAVARSVRPDILHGHGAKGGLYARLAGRRLGIPSVYTPHGGSLHFEWASPQGMIFLSAERALRRIGSGLLFVCDFERQRFDAKIGIGGKPNRVVFNGLWPDEIAGVSPDPDAADFIYLGELRKLKGVDVLLQALKSLEGATCTIAGDGEDRQEFETLASALGLADRVRFTGSLPARRAFAMGRVLVMPSRAESFPYVVLEAAAAGLPIIASRVGGIPEVLPANALVAPAEPEALAAAMAELKSAPQLCAARGAAMQRLVADRFSAAAMCAAVTEFYRDLLSVRYQSSPVPQENPN